MSIGDDGGYGGDRGSGTGQTRTRLPDGESDTYGSARRARMGLSSRNLVTVVGVVVLLIAAIAFANRGGSGNSETGADSAGPAKDPAAARPTTPTGTKPVTTKTAGIASGFPHTDEGAQSAAANYVVALNSDGMYNTARRQEIVQSVYAPSVAAARKSALDTTYGDPAHLQRFGLKPDGTAPAGLTFISRANPVGTKTEAFTNDKAKVSVWYSALFGLAGANSQKPVTESWYTTTYDLQWVGGDWKIVDFTQQNGPAPIGRDQAVASADDMAKAVRGYGGFTYAR
ncbi:hypothetical protein ADL22_09695 [Streptomyces sp. NRRL F-4489]|uniref:hypothetical protein n=1 Tax=Streptomyces sp. NRRL F-4489 TaxID=1609095 RepID=UPI000749FF90|nr:hypothetical protein [Streptomyces sp. NRRL F-4489]KUL48128.1 hypothetical protein ADL22_09695 [Streptomyces sp. NRRL F-4489]